MRLIDADELIERLLESRREETETTLKLERFIKKQPTIEPKPKRGRWIRNFYELANGIGVSLVTCDQCYSGEHGTMWNYCPNCGAKME